MIEILDALACERATDARWARLEARHEAEASRWRHEACEGCRWFRDVFDRVGVDGTTYVDDRSVGVCVSDVDYLQVVDGGGEQAACEAWEAAR